MMVVGLTGGIGSGKTTVANFFMEIGIPVYITDTEAKRLMHESREVREKITNLFGEEAYTDSLLNRKYISSLVFADEKRLEKLNNIIHPAVQQDFENWKNLQEAPYVLYETAILFEKGRNKHCDFSILVVAEYETKLQRLMKRDGTSLDEIEARMAHQWADKKKKKLADFVIKNEDLEKTYRKVKEIHEILLQKAKSR